ncbi:MAG: glycosyltransferase family 2 protein [Rudaea sp.]
MESRPDLSIVVVSFQVRELLERCLASLQPIGRPRLELWVVDNASTDGSAEMVASRFPGVRLIANADNRGFAAANNEALCRAEGRYVMLLNPDTEIPSESPNSLERLVDFMDSHPHAGACGPQLSYGDGSFQHSAFGFPSLAQIYFDLFPTNWRLAESRLNGRYSRSAYQAGRPFKVDHPLGAAFLARRETAEQVGWLDEEYFIYAEEVDWARRIRKAGWDIWCIPSARIIHYEARSTVQFRDRMLVELWRARFRFFRKHYSPAFVVAAGLLVTAGMSRASTAARRAQARGKMNSEELERRLRAYRQVVQIAKNGPG